MAFLLKELVFLAIVATALTYPWKPMANGELKYQNIVSCFTTTIAKIHVHHLIFSRTLLSVLFIKALVCFVFAAPAFLTSVLL